MEPGPYLDAGPGEALGVQALADRPVRAGRRCGLAGGRRPAGTRHPVLRADRGGGQPRHVVRPAAAPGRRGGRRRRDRRLHRRPVRGLARHRLVAAEPDRGAGDVDRVPARRGPALRDPGRGAVDRGEHADPGPRGGADPVDRRPGRRCGGAGRGHGRARGAAAPAAGAGGRGDAQDRRAAAGGRRGDGGRRGRAGAGAAGRRAVDRPPDPGAPGGRRRGPVGGGVLAVPGPAQGRPAPDGRAGRPARPGAAQHPGAGPADGGGRLPPAPGAGLLLAARPGPRRRRRRGGRRAQCGPDGGQRAAGAARGGQARPARSSAPTS